MKTILKLMGYYFRLHINTILKKDIPQEVIEILNTHINGNVYENFPAISIVEEVYEQTPKPPIDHPFFNQKRWMNLFHCHIDLPKPQFFQHPGGYYELQLDAEINYGYEEITQFVNWISPYIAGRKKKQFIGWYKGESYETSTINLYVERP